MRPTNCEEYSNRRRQRIQLVCGIEDHLECLKTDITAAGCTGNTSVAWYLTKRARLENMLLVIDVTSTVTSVTEILSHATCFFCSIRAYKTHATHISYPLSYSELLLVNVMTGSIFSHLDGIVAFRIKCFKPA